MHAEIDEDGHGDVQNSKEVHIAAKTCPPLPGREAEQEMEGKSEQLMGGVPCPARPDASTQCGGECEFNLNSRPTAVLSDAANLSAADPLMVKLAEGAVPRRSLEAARSRGGNRSTTPGVSPHPSATSPYGESSADEDAKTSWRCRGGGSRSEEHNEDDPKTLTGPMEGRQCRYPKPTCQRGFKSMVPSLREQGQQLQPPIDWRQGGTGRPDDAAVKEWRRASLHDDFDELPNSQMHVQLERRHGQQQQMNARTFDDRQTEFNRSTDSARKTFAKPLQCGVLTKDARTREEGDESDEYGVGNGDTGRRRADAKAGDTEDDVRHKGYREVQSHIQQRETCRDISTINLVDAETTYARSKQNAKRSRSRMRKKEQS